MGKLVLLFITSAFVSNVVLSRFLGLCSFVGVSKKIKTAVGMGLAVVVTNPVLSYIL